MLYEFVTTYRQAIIDKASEKVSTRPWPAPSTDELQNGVPLFLTQLVTTLHAEATNTPPSLDTIGADAMRHGGDLLARGFTASQVVHDYGDICQSITELAVELNAPITTEEFHTLNRLLDTAIAEAVTEYARLTAQSQNHAALEQSAMVAQEIRGMINTALFAFDALKRGAVAINGSTGAVLGRSMLNVRALVDSTLAVVRLDNHQGRRERLSVAAFLDEMAAAGGFHAEYRGLRFTIEPVDPQLMIDVDPQLLASAVTNLLNNAFKYTHDHGRVTLRAVAVSEHLRIEVEDECGGLPEPVVDPSKPSSERRGRDRSGLGQGLAIARKVVKAQGGDIHTRNIRGKGCVFVIEVPLAIDVTAAATTSETPAR
jgi:signal transduction histidine kinase